MKKQFIIQASFGIFLSWCLNTQAAEVFDFDVYRAQMKSLRKLDKKAEQELYQLYGPLDNHEDLQKALEASRTDEDEILKQVMEESKKEIDGRIHQNQEDELLRKILEESARTAEIEDIQREINNLKQKEIEINEEIGKLTQEVQKKWDVFYGAWTEYLKEKEYLEFFEIVPKDGEEKEKVLRVLIEKQSEALNRCKVLQELHRIAKEDLTKLEEEEKKLQQKSDGLAERLKVLRSQ